MCPGAWWHRPRWSRARFLSDFYWGHARWPPRFFRVAFLPQEKLLRLGGLLLLAHALELLVDLQRRLDSVGGVWLGCVRGVSR